MHSRLHAHIGTLRQLEILLAVYEHDGITAASEALHLTQPTVSAQVKKLTNAIGTPLYNQVGRKLIDGYGDDQLGRRAGVQGLTLPRQPFVEELDSVMSVSLLRIKGS